MSEQKKLYPWIAVDEFIGEIKPGLPKQFPVAEFFVTAPEWVPVTREELKEAIEREKAKPEKPVRTAAQIAANVVAKRRARKKAAKAARQRNRR